MSVIGTLTHDTVRAHVSEQNFARGDQYFRNGAILNTRRQGSTLKANCEGSQPTPYRVEATVADGKIVVAHCSCPVGGTGHCKHVAALLLTWTARPADFIEIEALDTALERRGKSELIALVKGMLRRVPELEVMLESPLPTSGERPTPVSAETYQRRAAKVFRTSNYGWGAATEMANDLEAIKQIGDDFVTRGDNVSAAAVYQGVAAAIAEDYEETEDEGDISSVLGACARGLGDCLIHVEDAGAREAILRSLFDIFRFDADYGGIEIGDPLPALVAERASAEERRLVASWVRDVLPAATDTYHGYKRQTYGSFLLDLEGDALDDEAFMRICRETGRIEDLVNRLLTLDRLAEATDEAKLVDDYPLLGLTQVFVRHGQADAAEQLMQERIPATKDTRLVVWMRGRFEARGDTAGALPLAERAFHLNPSFQTYQPARDLARQLGEWDNLRPQLLESLKTRGAWHLLVQIYLDEGEIDAALDLVNTRDTAHNLHLDGWVALQVAAAAEEARPQAAVEIYKRSVEGLIAGKSRDNYHAACLHLTRIRAVYARLADVTEWERYVADLRDRYRRLPAFQDELKQAEL